MESTELRFRPRVDDALYNDGNSRMVGLEAGRIPSSLNAAELVCRSIDPERSVVMDFLSSPSTKLGVRRNCRTLAGNCWHNHRVPESLPNRRAVADAISCVGEFCQHAELRTLAIELMYSGCFIHAALLRLQTADEPTSIGMIRRLSNIL